MEVDIACIVASEVRRQRLENDPDYRARQQAAAERVAANARRYARRS